MSIVHYTTTEKLVTKIQKLAADNNLLLDKDNEVQTLTVTGTPTGGTFTLGFGTEETGNIAYNASADTVVTALKALDGVGASDISGSGGAFPGTAVVITFGGDLAAQNMEDITLEDNSMTGGSTPTLTVSETTRGYGDEVLATRRLEQAYDDIQGVLMSRGLTAVQVSTWQRGEEFQLDIATFWYAKDCGWGGKIVDEVDWTRVFDRREELKTVAILDNTGTLLVKSGVVASGLNLIDINANLGIYP